MKTYHSIYQFIKNNGTQTTLPYVKLDEKSTDKKIVWKAGLSRTDKISQEYYGSPIYGKIIMMANPNFGGLEFDIPNNAIIRVPFPLEQTLSEYFTKLQNIKNI